MLVHTDQKPYQCELCDQAFRQKQLLRRHQNLYHNPNYVPPTPRDKQHECSECGRAFRHKGNLIRHMAIHDPESAVHERAMALKIGRQKRIQLVNGQQVEVMDDEDEEEEDENDTPMVQVEGLDGQQYVVLEVIQLQDGDGTEQTVAVVGEDEITADLLNDESTTVELNDPAIIGQLESTENGKNFYCQNYVINF